MRALALATLLALASGTVRLAAQAPAPTPAPPCDPDDAAFVCGQRAPEDLVAVPGAPWVVASAYAAPGGVLLVNTATRATTVAYPSSTAVDRFDAKTYGACPGPPAMPFTTHGLSLQPGANGVHRLYVVLHGSRESIEVFELDARRTTPALTWIGCAVAPDPIGLNSVRWLADGGFVATNYLARGVDAATRTRMGQGERNGELWEWHTATGWQKVPGSDASGANGIEISENGRWYYIAAWGSQSFFRLSRGQAAPAREEVPLGFRVDNIRWAQDGSLLAAGQGGAPGAQMTQIVTIDPNTLAVKEIARRPNVPGFGGGTVAVEVGRTLWVGSFRGDRIAIFPAP